MQELEGYFEDGRFHAEGQTITLPERRRVIITILDEPIPERGENEQAKVWREFFEAVNASDEVIPETFERFNIAREVEL